MKRLKQLNPPWNLAPAIADCATAFPGAPLQCVDTLGKRVSGIPPEGFVQTCASTFDHEDTINECLMLSHRPFGIEELNACSRLNTAGLRRQCIERVEEPLFQPHVLVDTCVDAFGEGVSAMRCFNAVARAETPPNTDIVACTEAFSEESDRLGCIKRFSNLDWSPTPLVEACQTEMPDNALECMHVTAAGQRSAPDVSVVEACVTAVGADGEHPLECLRMMRNRPKDPAGAVRSCTSLFEKTGDRLVCVELARADPDPERLSACASEEKTGKRRKCVAGN